MKNSSYNARIGIAAAIILGTIGYLAVTGVQSAKSYYVTIAELQGMSGKAAKSHLRVEGFVKPGSIHHDGTHVDFVLTEYESHSAKARQNPRSLTVSYKGSEPPPDTFKDNAQALAEGEYGKDGIFRATQLQAKCASKYAPAKPGSRPAMNSAAAISPATTSAAPRAE